MLIYTILALFFSVVVLCEDALEQEHIVASEGGLLLIFQQAGPKARFAGLQRHRLHAVWAPGSLRCGIHPMCTRVSDVKAGMPKASRVLVRLFLEVAPRLL